MAAKTSEQTETTHEDINIIYEEVVRTLRSGEQQKRRMPVGKMVPVVLIKTPRAFKQEHENTLRADLRFICKRHDRDGKTYFEVGESDDVIEARIKESIDILRGIGIEAVRSVEFTPHMTRATW